MIVIKFCNEDDDKVQYTTVLSRRNVEFLEEAIKDYRLKDELERALMSLRSKIHSSRTNKGDKC